MTDSITTYTPGEFLVLLRQNTSSTCVVLVEGRHDQGAIENLRDELNINESEVQVVSAQIIENPNQRLGNREKVELICTLVGAEANNPDRSTFASKFLGFVDREYREFQIEDVIQDNLADHYRVNRLVWTRGHSIENYYFDADILIDAFRSYLINNNDFAASSIRANFPCILKVAAAISLLLRDSTHFSSYNLINWEAIEISDQGLYVNTERWREGLLRRNQTTERADIILREYMDYYSLVAGSDENTIRWVIHGHAGIYLFMHCFARCIVENDTNRANAIIRREDEKADLCLVAWLRQLRNNGVHFPLLIFDLLGIEYSL